MKSIDNRNKETKVPLVIDFAINDCHFNSVFNSFEKKNAFCLHFNRYM